MTLKWIRAITVIVLFQPKYTCICDDGWTSSATDPACVVDVNECQSNRPVCSTDPPVPCINLPGTFTCGSCPAGKNMIYLSHDYPSIKLLQIPK